MTLSGRCCRRLATLTVDHADVNKREIKSRMSHIDVNDASIIASGIQP